MMTEITQTIAASVITRPDGNVLTSDVPLDEHGVIASIWKNAIDVDPEMSQRYDELNDDYQATIRRICVRVAALDGNLVRTEEVELLDRALRLVVELFALAEQTQNPIILPTDDEALEIVRWAVESQRMGEAHVVTTICPDYGYEIDYATGAVTFTMDRVDDDIGYIGEGVLCHYQAVLPLLARYLGVPVYWHPMYAGFEASLPTRGETTGEHGTKAEKIAESAAACAEAIGMPVGISPYCYGMPLEQYDALKTQLPDGVFSLNRGGALDDTTDGRDWAMVALLNPAPNVLLLEGTSAPAGRAMYDKVTELYGIRKARLFLNVTYQ